MKEFIKPMLAYKVGKKEIDWAENIYLQPKLDGVRCNIYLDGNNKVVSYSRTGKKFYNLKHIEDSLLTFFVKYPDMVLDGELYNHDLRHDFEKIISLVRKQKPTDLDASEAENLIQFHCYDYIENPNKDVYSERTEFLKHPDRKTDLYTGYVVYVPTLHILGGLTSANFWHKQHLELGYEGSILRLDKLYENKRSYNLQKFKDFQDTEATIIGYVPGKGKRTGTLGKFIMRDDDGIEFGCPPGKGYNYKDLANMLDNIKDYIGKRATFTFFERTKALSYRHPHYKTLRNYE